MILKATNLCRFPELLHGFGTRELGSDYSRIVSELDIPAESIVTLKQIHSNIVVIPSTGNNSPQPPLKLRGGEPRRGEGELPKHGFSPSAFASNELQNGNDKSTENPEGDALITDQRGFFLGIRTADCVPLLVYDPRKKAVAAIHAGWKGVLVGIIENSIKEMRERFDSDPSVLIVALGTALCVGCFEVGPDIADQFRQKFGERLVISKGEGDRSFLDYREASRMILIDLGVRPENIELMPYCTKCRPDLYFSFRRGDESLRQLSFIGLR